MSQAAQSMSQEFKKAVGETLANEGWWKENTAAVKKMLPETWTHIANLNGLQLGFAMKLIGIDWRNQDEFGRVMVFFEKIGIMERQLGVQIRANSQWEFKPTAMMVDR